MLQTPELYKSIILGCLDTENINTSILEAKGTNGKEKNKQS